MNNNELLKTSTTIREVMNVMTMAKIFLMEKCPEVDGEAVDTAYKTLATMMCEAIPKDSFGRKALDDTTSLTAHL